MVIALMVSKELPYFYDERSRLSLYLYGFTFIWYDSFTDHLVLIVLLIECRLKVTSAEIQCRLFRATIADGDDRYLDTIAGHAGLDFLGGFWV